MKQDKCILCKGTELSEDHEGYTYCHDCKNGGVIDKCRKCKKKFYRKVASVGELERPKSRWCADCGGTFAKS